MPIFNNQLAGAAGQGGAAAYQIDRSLRFNSADSAHLNRTPSSAGNRKTWTWSAWVKRSKITASQNLFGVRGASAGESDSFSMQFGGYGTGAGNLVIGYGNGAWKITSQVFRDVSAWYHFVVAFDSTQSTGTDRVKLYVNGSQVTDFDTDTAPTSNLDSAINSTAEHRLGSYASVAPQYIDTYLADVHFIDGQALTADDFGEPDDNGVWQPKEFVATGPNNGTTWSSGAGSNFESARPASNGFNGDPESFTRTDNASVTATVTLPSSVPFSTLQVRGARDSGNGTITINGVDVSSQFTSSSSTLETVTITGVTSPLTSIALTGISGSAQPRFSEIIVDGVALVDGDTTNIGVNGFHLDFSDNSSNAALGDDSSGNNNDWTPNNFSVAETTVSHWRQATSSDNPSNAVGTVTYRTQRALENPQTSALVWDHQNTNVIGLQNITGVTSLRLRISSRGGAKVGVNTGAMVSIGSLGGDYSNANDANSVWYTWSNPPSTITSIAAYGGGSGTGNFCSVWAIEVNGVRLEDSDASECDSLIDTPTNYEASSGNNGGNYATLNALDSNIGSNLTNGNLDAAGSSNWSAGHARGTFGLTSGKWYWEVTRTGGSGATAQIGFCNKAFSLTTSYGSLPADSWTFAFGNGTEILRPSGGGTNYFSGSAMGVGDIAGIALDMDNKTAVFYKNGTAGATIDLSATSTGSTDNIDELFPLVGVYNANVALNGGQRPFAYTPPTGYKSLCTTNLTDPTIADGSTAMDVVTYDGNGTSQTVSGLNVASDPDLIIIKSRNGTNKYFTVADSVRGIGSNGAYLRLFTNETLAEADDGYDITGITSDGFSVTNGSYSNASGENYVAWAWDGGTTTATNTDGSITSTVRANPSAGFSIVEYDGKSGGGSWGHGLNAPPDFIIFKRYTATQNWFVWLRESDGTYLEFEGLNNDRAAYSSRNNVSATDSTVTITTAAEFNSDTNSDYVAYCFNSVSQYSSFGSYTGNGSSTDGTFVFTGMRPRWIMIKNSGRGGGSQGWYIYDSERDEINVANTFLVADQAYQEQVTSNNVSLTSLKIDILSNGFKHYNDSYALNFSGDTYIYACFAESPFKYSRAR